MSSPFDGLREEPDRPPIRRPTAKQLERFPFLQRIPPWAIFLALSLGTAVLFLLVLFTLAGRPDRAKGKGASRQAEEEHDADGLVLLRKTLKCQGDHRRTEITGTVVNRRSRNLRTTRIMFNLYDASGAQIGTAADIVSGLEAGGRWSFKAVAYREGVVTYKVSELEGW